MIGIDKTTINNIKIISIDFDKLIDENKENVSVSRDGTTVPLPTNIPGQYKEVHEIRIKDNTAFNTFKFAIDTTCGRLKPYCLMTLNIRSVNGDNAKPLNIKEYKEMLEDVKEYVSKQYGIRLNFDDVGFKEIEINCTFKLDSSFEEYEYLLQRLVELAPKRYKVSEPQYIVDEETGKRRIPEIVFYNDSTKLKVYDKKFQLKELYRIRIDDDLMRIEYTFKRPQKVETIFGTNKVNELTDEAIKEYIKKGIEKDLINPVYKHIKQADKQLLKVAEQYQKMYPRGGWGKLFITDAKSLEVDKKRLLIDNQQLKDIIDKIAKSRTTKKRLYKEIECIKATDGNLLKLEYIHDNIL